METVVHNFSFCRKLRLKVAVAIVDKRFMPCGKTRNTPITWRENYRLQAGFLQFHARVTRKRKKTAASFILKAFLKVLTNATLTNSGKYSKKRIVFLYVSLECYLDCWDLISLDCYACVRV